ncbi:MAG TPA: MFS transporter [Acidisarcina sp.]|nr:MFS transporter [Acidisarcina sp.]
MAERHRTLLPVFLYFLVAGVATVMLGPILPTLNARWHLPDAQLGTLFVASFVGQLLGAWFATRRLGLSLLCGALCSALGCLGLTYSGFLIAHVAFFVIGLGLGAGLTAGNVIIGTIDAVETSAPLAPERKRYSTSRLLALLNMGWGLGAIACPLLLRWSLHRQVFEITESGTTGNAAGNLKWFFLLVMIGLTIAAVLFAFLLPKRYYGLSLDSGSGTRLPWPTLWLFLATLFLYIGIENSLGGWLPTYGQRIIPGSLSSGIASSISFYFWIGQLCGRSLMALLLRDVNERRAYRGSLVALILIVGVLILAPHLTAPILICLTIITAMSLAPLYPLVVSFMLSRTGNNPRLGRIFASASLGGATLPWLTGLVSTYFQALRIGLLVPTFGALMLLMLSSLLPHDRDEQPQVVARP